MKALWNRIIYYIYAPLYDLIVRPLRPEREEAVELLRPSPGEKWLIVGCGTGLDLEVIPGNANITALDIRPSMVMKTFHRAKQTGMAIDARIMNAGEILFRPESFDIVLLHLVLSSVPDPGACIREAERVLKPHGRISILDKFPVGRFPAIRKRPWPYRITETFISGIDHELVPLLKQANLTVEQERMDPLKSRFRNIIAVKGKNNKTPHILEHTTMAHSGVGLDHGD
ncbi:MAG: methyltransferase domain-containing protein [Desulfobacteraceae bacterium]|nr:methyltransferase domain-containing protein [Desulfobacteraceae bacterium]